MTRHALLSDIHANIEALEAVMAFTKGLSIDKYYSLGDVVGYGANPNECVDIVRGFDANVMGNHDRGTLNATSHQFLSAKEYAQQIMTWTEKELTGENKDFLQSLHSSLTVNDFIVSHGSCFKPGWIKYVKDSGHAPSKENLANEFLELDRIGARLSFYGHSHIPVMHLLYYHFGQTCHVVPETDKIYLKRKKQHNGEKYNFNIGVINVGSVGQPRDYDPRACFLVYDDKQQTVEHHRVAYDVQKASDKILAAGFDPYLADRILIGE